MVMKLGVRIHRSDDVELLPVALQKHGGVLVRQFLAFQTPAGLAELSRVYLDPSQMLVPLHFERFQEEPRPTADIQYAFVPVENVLVLVEHDLPESIDVEVQIHVPVMRFKVVKIGSRRHSSRRSWGCPTHSPYARGPTHADSMTTPREKRNPSCRDISDRPGQNGLLLLPATR